VAERPVEEHPRISPRLVAKHLLVRRPQERHHAVVGRPVVEHPRISWVRHRLVVGYQLAKQLRFVQERRHSVAERPVEEHPRISPRLVAKHRLVRRPRLVEERHHAVVGPPVVEHPRVSWVRRRPVARHRPLQRLQLVEEQRHTVVGSRHVERPRPYPGHRIFGTRPILTISRRCRGMEPGMAGMIAGSCGGVFIVPSGPPNGTSTLLNSSGCQHR